MLAAGLAPSLLFRLYSTLNQALGRPMLVTWLQIGSLALKVPLSIWLVGGGAGVPALGAVGCAWATFAVNYLMLAVALMMLRSPVYRPYRIWNPMKPPQWRQILGFARLGLPGGMANLVEVTSFTLISLFVFLTTRTTFGRRVYAMGGNEKAAKLSGINTERLTFMIFVIMGALAALAGLIFAARLNVATPKAGLGFELDVIAACFIGGAATTGGVGKVIGAVIGAFIMGVMNNGMSIMGIGIDWQQVIKGAVLMLAVFLDVYYKNKN